MLEEIIMAGFGGQGILLAGQLLSYAGIIEGKKVCWVPSYGTEMRGGRASCMVSISSNDIDSPIIESCHTLLAFDETSLREFEDYVRKGGLLIWNSSLIKEAPERNDIKCIKVKLNEIASAMGDFKLVNMIMLGVYCSQKDFISREAIFQAIRDLFPPRLSKSISLNKKAFTEGAAIFQNRQA
jgi:2-oxoglutarate ferredoxin oxidoreductase subunit gamma